MEQLLSKQAAMPNLKSVWLKGHSAPFLFKGVIKDGKPVFYGDFSDGFFSAYISLIESVCEWSDIKKVFLNNDTCFEVGDTVEYRYDYDGDWNYIRGVIDGFKFSVADTPELGQYVAAEIRMDGEKHTSNYAIHLLKKIPPVLDSDRTSYLKQLRILGKI